MGKCSLVVVLVLGVGFAGYWVMELLASPTEIAPPSASKPSGSVDGVSEAAKSNDTDFKAEGSSSLVAERALIDAGVDRTRGGFRWLAEHKSASKTIEGPDVEMMFNDVLLRARQGDSGAALSLHFARPPCTSTELIRQSELCRLQPELASEPLYWLLAAAVGGDFRALTPLVGEARELARKGDDPERVRELARAALALGESAVAAGVLDALALLAVTYSDGVLVVADPARAYAYWSAYASATGDLAAREAADKQRALLREGDWLAVRKFERGIALQASLCAKLNC